MKLSISNFRRISSASISPAGITLLAGPNGSGKTSILQAIAAVTTGAVIPMDELKKNESGFLIHTGTGRGEIQMDSLTGTATVVYPAAIRATDGAPLEITRMAAGLDSFIDLSAQERVQYINQLMHSEPGKQEVEDILAKIGIQPAIIARLWQTIDAQGWDAAHKQAKESGSKLKGGWEEITGDRYGSEKAATWLPVEWETDLEAATEATLTAELAHERQWLEAAISDNAVNAAEIARLQKATENLPKLTEEYNDIKTQLDALFNNENDLRHALRDIPAATQQATVPCPHCKQPVIISGNKLLKPGTVSANDAAEQAEKIKSTEESLAAVKQEIVRVNTELGHKKAAVDAANKAAGMLAGLQAGTKNPAATAAPTAHGSVDDCRARVKRAENRLAAWAKRQNAASKHEAISKNQQIIDILAPSGLRQQRLKESLAIINTKLASIAAATGWLPVEIEDDMSISYGDYQYILLSKSTQYRVRVSLQAAFTMLDGSQILLIDGADILDSAGRNGLFKMLTGLQSMAIMAIVAMTIDKQDKIPAIEKLGGCAYWIENGTATKAR